MYTIDLRKTENCLRMIAIPLALLYIFSGCGGGSSSPASPVADSGSLAGSANDGTSSDDWSRVEMKDLTHTGMVSPHVRTAMNADHIVHTVYYGSSGSDVAPYTVSHFSFDLEELTADDPEIIQQIDNCNLLTLALGNGDAPVVGYQGGEIKECGDADQADAMFAVRTGDAWVEHTAGIGYVPPERNPVIDDGFAGRNMAFAIDRFGSYHAAYQYFYEGCDAFGMAYPDLLYVCKDDGSPDADVDEETIEGNVFSNGMATVQNAVGDPVAMAVDNYGTPIVFYYASLVSDNRYGLRTAKRVNGQWQKSWVDEDVVVGSISCALKSDGSPAVAYYVNDTDGEGERRQILKYAVQVSGAWITRTVDESSRCGDYCSLAFDEDGRPLVAYYDMETNSGSREKKDLKLATLENGSWGVESVSTLGTVGLYNNLWVDEDGTTYICSYSETDKTIYLFYR